MINQILRRAEQFISIQSDPGHIDELNSILDLALSSLKMFTIEHFERNGVRSALIHNQKKRPDIFRILLNAHLDVIPGKPNQYTPQLKNNKLYGVGAMDMKTNASCLIEVFQNTAKKNNTPIALQLTTDEESGGFDGTQYQVEEGVRADFVIAGETTAFDIVHQAKGILWLKLTTHGTSAHSAYPWKGKNAVNEMQKILSQLHQKYPEPESETWTTTLNFATIETPNTAFNKIPDQCSVGLDIRFIPVDAEAILDEIKKILPDHVTIEVVADEAVMHTPQENTDLLRLQNITAKIRNTETVLRGAHGSSDARHFTPVGGAGIEFGPIGGGIGSDEEWIDISSVETYYAILEKFLLSID